MKKVLKGLGLLVCLCGVLVAISAFAAGSFLIGVFTLLLWIWIGWLILRKPNSKETSLSNDAIEVPVVVSKPVGKSSERPLTSSQAQSLIDEALLNKKDVSFSVSVDEIDDLASKYPYQKLYLQAPITLKIEAAPRFKAYKATMEKVGGQWEVENIFNPDDSLTYHVLRVQVRDIHYKTSLAQTLKPLSRVIKIQYRGVDYPISEFKSAVYSYSEGVISKIEDYFDPSKKTIWQPRQEMDSTISLSFPDQLSFVAIDFETANNSRSSACSIGLVVVNDGVISEKIHRYINPGDIEWGSINISKHGIRPSMVKDASNFEDVWKELSPLFANRLIVAHNAASFDISVLRACLNQFSIPLPRLAYTCTMEAAKLIGEPAKLNDICREQGIELDHHDALSDAAGCAQIAINIYQRTNSFEAFRLREIA